MKKLLRFLPKKYREKAAIKDNCYFIHKALSQQGLSLVGTRAYIKRYSHALNMSKYDNRTLSLITKTLHELWDYWDSKGFEDFNMIDYRNCIKNVQKDKG